MSTALNITYFKIEVEMPCGCQCVKSWGHTYAGRSMDAWGDSGKSWYLHWLQSHTCSRVTTSNPNGDLKAYPVHHE
jgi:hypothetical protein